MIRKKSIMQHKELPYFILHDVKELERMNPASGWLSIHEQLIEAISAYGIPLDVVPRGTPLPQNMDGIFIGKHTRLNRDNCWNVKKAYLPNYFYFDRTGYSGWAEMANDVNLFTKALGTEQAVADAFFCNLYADTVAVNISKAPQSEEPFSPPPRSFVFLPLQLSFDSVMKLSRIEHFRFYEAVRDWAGNNNLDLVVKPHPASKGDKVFGRDCESTQKIVNDVMEREHVYTSNASIHYILPLCDAVFCINSGVGFEALIHNKPVFSAGHSDYHWATHRLSSIDEMIEIKNWNNPFLSECDVRKFLYFFLSDYLVNVRDPSTVQKRIALAVDEFHVKSNC
ncbi:hypothetical protein VB757_01985 [Synechococcus sp. BA-132 BA5]|nr:hypothetical protein [Synechococcus sp. BA-132 BA5]